MPIFAYSRQKSVTVATSLQLSRKGRIDHEHPSIIMYIFAKLGEDRSSTSEIIVSKGTVKEVERK